MGWGGSHGYKYDYNYSYHKRRGGGELLNRGRVRARDVCNAANREDRFVEVCDRDAW